MSIFDISIVVPTHNRWPELAELLESLACQTTPPDRFEVVVVADGCTDATLEQIAAVRVPYRLRWIEQEQRGPAAARNAGAELAEAPVLLFLDDDMLAQKDLVEAHIAIRRSNPLVVAIGRIVQDPACHRPGWEHWEEAMLQKKYEAIANDGHALGGWLFYSGNASIPTRLFFEQSGFDVDLRRGEDIELGLRLEQAGTRFVFASSAIALHRGFRSYADWLRIHYVYGRLRVILGRDKQHRRLLDDAGRHFRKQHWLNRIVAQLCLRWPSLRRPTIDLLRVSAAAFDAAGLFAVSRYCYSGIACVLHWAGVADELDDPTAVRRIVFDDRTGSNLASSTHAGGSQ